MDFSFKVNVDTLARQLDQDVETLNQKLHEAVAGLAAQTHAKVVELAQQNLHSTREQYLDNLDFYPLAHNVWVVVLNEPAMWIESGMEPRSMVDDLLRTGAKVSKDGSRYKSIPFGHAQPETQTPVALRSMEETLKSELRKRKIPVTKIEKNPDGSPKLGLLHKFDVNSERKGPTGIPLLHGVRVYQRRQKPEGPVSRSIMTFRTVSSKHKAQGRWFHPGLDARNFLDRAFTWAEQTWQNEILPILAKG